MAKPAKGKMFAKTTTNPKTGRKIKVSYGQAGKAKDGGKRIRPGTGKGDSYCARSAGQMKKHPKLHEIQTAHYVYLVRSGSALVLNLRGHNGNT